MGANGIAIPSAVTSVHEYHKALPFRIQELLPLRQVLIGEKLNIFLKKEQQVMRSAYASSTSPKRAHN